MLLLLTQVLSNFLGSGAHPTRRRVRLEKTPRGNGLHRMYRDLMVVSEHAFPKLS